MRPVDILVILVFIGTIVLYGGGFLGGTADERVVQENQTVSQASMRQAMLVKRRNAGARSPRRPLPEPRPGRDPLIIIESDVSEGNTVGTAFSLDHDGVWMTARHVVEGCDRLGLQTPVRPTVWINDVRVSENADLAILVGELAGPAFAMADRLPDVGETGYGVGYPQGNPGDVSGTLIGRAISRSMRWSNFEEPVLVWAEKTRIPKFEGGLGGISGGPLLMQDGAVMGVIVSGSPRRGRFNTSAPRAFLPFLDDAPISSDPDDRVVDLREVLDSRTLPELGPRLRNSEAVARVICVRE